MSFRVIYPLYAVIVTFYYIMLTSLYDGQPYVTL